MGKRRNSENEAPKVDDLTALKLWVAAGGRCSIPGCNKYLLRDDLTMDEIKQGHIAHIVGQSTEPGSPRGEATLPLSERSKISNLILVCPNHHRNVDDKYYLRKYSVEILQKFKQQHEQRIKWLTSLAEERKSNVICLKSRINGDAVQISFDEISSALFQQMRYPAEERGTNIDLTGFPMDDKAAFLEAAKEAIDEHLRPLYTKGIRAEIPSHISVFALAPMPILVYLGSRLSNKIPLTLYQKHREPETWNWQTEEQTVEYKLKTINEGSDTDKVALILSLSGLIDLNSLPPQIDKSFYVYEITLVSQTPNPRFLQSLADLGAFQRTYHDFLAMVRNTHSQAAMIHLFPAVPAPIAISCGRELLPKVNPGLLVYDHNKKYGGFDLVLEVYGNEFK